MTATPTRFIRASIVNEGKVEVGDVLIARDGTIGAVGAACDQHPEVPRPSKSMPKGFG